MRRSCWLELTLLAGLVTSAPLLGCAHGGPVTLPNDRSAVELTYDWSDGARFAGNIRRQSVISRDGGETDARTVAYDVHLTVLGRDSATGGLRLSAKMSSLEITWPARDEDGVAARTMIDEITQHLEGVTLRFSVAQDGEIIELPALPTELDAATLAVLRAMIDGLTSAFVVLPERSVQPDRDWIHTSSPPTTGAAVEARVSVERTTRGEFKTWLAADGQWPKRAQLGLAVDERREYAGLEQGGFTRKRSELTAEYDPEARWTTHVSGTETLFDARSNEKVRFEVNWRRQAAQSEDAPSLVREVQRGINDPCHPEYVGLRECVKPGSAPETEPSGQAEQSEQPESASEGEQSSPAEADAAEDRDPDPAESPAPESSDPEATKTESAAAEAEPERTR